MKAQVARLVYLFFLLSLLNPSVPAKGKPEKSPAKGANIDQIARQLVRIEVKMVQTKYLHRRSNWLKWLFTKKITKIGNGYYIEPNRVITNNHVINTTLPKDLRRLVGVDEEDPLTVIEIRVRYRKAEIVKLDTANDLAELRVDAKRPKSEFPVPSPQSQKGIQVFSINKDDEGKKILVKGEVIGPYTLAVFKDGAYEPTDVNPTYRLPPNMVAAPVLGLRLHIARGWSGCWVFDSDGKFLGIVRAWHDPSSLTLVIPAHTVDDFIRQSTTGILGRDSGLGSQDR